MKRKKYGEETVVIRIPASRKQAVLKFLEQFEVIDPFASLDESQDISKNALQDAYIQGFIECFNAWEQYNFCLPYALSGNAEHIPLLLDMLNGRVPETAMSSVTDTLMKTLMRSNRKFSKVESQLLIMDKLIDDSFAKAKIKAQSFIAKQSTSVEKLSVESNDLLQLEIKI